MLLRGGERRAGNYALFRDDRLRHFGYSSHPGLSCARSSLDRNSPWIGRVSRHSGDVSNKEGIHHTRL